VKEAAMRHPVLVLNAGSSSLKFSVYDTRDDRSLDAGVHGQIDSLHVAPRLTVVDAHGVLLADRAVARPGHHAAIEALHAWFADHVGREAAFDGVGHRVVHGGPYFTAPVRIDARVLETIASLAPLAPLHQPHHVDAIRAVAAVAPELPQVACFDTAFHATMPALERELRCRARSPNRASCATAFTGCRTNMCRACSRNSIPRGGSAAPSSRISATARACARSSRAAASRRRWASPPSTGCRWARARAASTPA
jgi:hypothetical protein